MKNTLIPLYFIEYAREYNKSRYVLEKIAYSTYSSDNHHIDMFREYLQILTGHDEIKLQDISVEIIDKYKEYCLSRGNKKESINKKLKPIFKAVEYASINGLIPASVDYAIRSRYFSLRSRKYESKVVEDHIHYLTKEQMQEFVNLYPEVKHDRTREYMDMFMFSFYACGLRFSDILTLEWSHIDWENKQIKKNLFKEKLPHMVPIMDGAMDILKRWYDKFYNDRFVFDLLPASFDLDDVEFLDYKRKSLNRSIHTSLRTLGEKLPTKLSSNLSMHTARHTFVIMALNNGVPIHVLTKLLGHRSVVATEKAYAKFLPINLAEELKIKCNFNFKPQ